MKRLACAAKKRGFTLIELMTVVVIIGVLASVAMPLVAKYLKKSKTAEAAVNLRKIYDGEVIYYLEEKTDAGGLLFSKKFAALSATPPVSTLGADKRPGNFEEAGWGAIRFNPDGPVLFSYETSAGGEGPEARFTARAMGAVDKDTKTSLFERGGSVDTAPGEVSGGAAIYMLDELE